MKCKQVKDLMGAYVYGDLSPEEMRDVRLHANTCADCRQDLQTRARAISAVSDRVPDLSDAERQRIAWFVEGAVHRGDAVPARGLRFGPALGWATAIAAGVAIGALVASNAPRSNEQQARRDDRPPVSATVKIQEEPVTVSAKDKPGDASKNNDGKPGDSDAARITSAIADGIRSAFRGGASVASRGREDALRKKTAPEEVVEEVPTPVRSPANEPQDSPTKLPNPTDVNDARTTASPDGE